MFFVFFMNSFQKKEIKSKNKEQRTKNKEQKTKKEAGSSPDFFGRCRLFSRSARYAVKRKMERRRTFFHRGKVRARASRSIVLKGKGRASLQRHRLAALAVALYGCHALCNLFARCFFRPCHGPCIFPVKKSSFAGAHFSLDSAGGTALLAAFVRKNRARNLKKGDKK
jgi:hypothetical protein